MPFREIALSPGAGERAFRVYDPSGPYTDANAAIDVEKGLPRIRAAWARERGGVEEYTGRDVKPEDNGNVAGKHLARDFPNKPAPLRAISAPRAGVPSPLVGEGQGWGGFQNIEGRGSPHPQPLPTRGRGVRAAFAGRSTPPHHAIRIRPRRHRHQGDDLRRVPREPGPGSRARARQDRTRRRRELRRRAFPSTSHRSSSAMRSPADAPSSRPTSITPNWSR